MKCEYMLPCDEPLLVGWGDPLPACLLDEGHKGNHLILTSKGEYALFLPYTEPCGDNCECAQDTEITNYECFMWEKISSKEAEELLNPRKEETKRSP